VTFAPVAFPQSRLERASISYASRDRVIGLKYSSEYDRTVSNMSGAPRH
jgi:hypothetical protein